MVHVHACVVYVCACPYECASMCVCVSMCVVSLCMCEGDGGVICVCTSGVYE